MADEAQTSANADTNAPAADTRTTDDQNTQNTPQDGAEGNADAQAQNSGGNTQTDNQGDGSGEGEGTGAPEEYEAFSLPEGMALNEAALEAASPVFKELGLQQESAQKLVDVFVQAQEAQENALSEQFRQTTEEWGRQCRDHKIYGGDKYDQTLSNIDALFKQVFGDKPRDPGDNASQDVMDAYNNHPNIAFRSMLNETGLGWNPQLFELLAKISSHVGEDGFSLGGVPPKGEGRDRAELMYPDAKS